MANQYDNGNTLGFTQPAGANADFVEAVYNAELGTTSKGEFNGGWEWTQKLDAGTINKQDVINGVRAWKAANPAFVTANANPALVQSGKAYLAQTGTGDTIAGIPKGLALAGGALLLVLLTSKRR